MSSIPQVSGQKVVKALLSVGFKKISQKGSHIKLRHIDGRIVIIPNHKNIKKGTLKQGILKPIGISVQEFIELLD